MRIVLVGFSLPFLYFGTASATFLYHRHFVSEAGARVRLLAYPPPTSAQRLLIFAPHPDDETLGCAGLIQQAQRAGADVRVVFLTNGDGFRVAVERQYRTVRVKPSDYVRFAELRQQEARRALVHLGVYRDAIHFLGYPDRGLTALWNQYWSPERPYVSPYTRTSRSPYPNAYREGAIYCGADLLQDIQAILLAARPTDVYVTHPSDDHPDHAAASAFVTLALLQQQDDWPWARASRLHYYLIHRGDWPNPQGLHTDQALTLPNEMMGLDTAWRARTLTTEQVERKEESILAYASQTAVMKRFLLSFARRCELFGQMNAAIVPRIPDGSTRLAADAALQERAHATLLEPVNDNLLRDFQGGGDIATISASRDRTTLYLRISTYQPIPGRMEFRLRLRYFGDSQLREAGGTCTVTVRAPDLVRPANLRASVRGNRLEIAIPLRELGYARRLALNLETRLAGLQIDRTGYRFLELPRTADTMGETGFDSRTPPIF